MPAEPPQPDPRHAVRVPPPKPDDTLTPEQVVAGAVAARDLLGARVAPASPPAPDPAPDPAPADPAVLPTPAPPEAAASLTELLDRVPRDRPATVLDLATGGGEGARVLVRRMRRNGRPVRLVVSDPDAFRRRAARETLGHLPEVEFAALDPLRTGLPGRAFDVVVCSRPLAGVASDDPAALLREMARLARVGIAFRERRPPRLPTLSDVADRVAGRTLPRFRPASPERLAIRLEAAGLGGASVTRLSSRGLVIVALPDEG